MNKMDLFSAVISIATGIGLIIVMFSVATILAPIIATGFLILLVYMFISDGQRPKRKHKKKKRKNRILHP